MVGMLSGHRETSKTLLGSTIRGLRVYYERRRVFGTPELEYDHNWVDVEALWAVRRKGKIGMPTDSTLVD